MDYSEYTTEELEDLISDIKQEIDRRYREQIQKYEPRVREAKAKYTIPQIVGFIWDLFQESYIDETAEGKLYEIADPDEQFNECSTYYDEYMSDDIHKKNPLTD